MPFLYGNHVVKAHVGKTTEDIMEHQGVVVYSMNDIPLVSLSSTTFSFSHRESSCSQGDPHRVSESRQEVRSIRGKRIPPLSSFSTKREFPSPLKDLTPSEDVLTHSSIVDVSDVGEYLRDEVRAFPVFLFRCLRTS